MKKFLPMLMMLVAIPMTYICAGAPYDTVYQLYINLTLSPETGDSQIEKNKQLFTDRFYDCASELILKFEKAALDHYDYCDQVHVNSEYRAKCKQENEPAKMHHWLREIVPVTRGEIRWSDSFMGAATILGKKAMEDMGMGGQYTQIVEASIPPWRPLMVCE